ncbi:MAG: ribonuclease III [Actinomycetota bacterium]
MPGGRNSSLDTWTMQVAGHVFVDRDILQRSLSHRSWCAEHGGVPSNERLEFLGDAILQWVVTDLIYRSHPDLSEGVLTELRKSLVNTETLAKTARDIDLGQWILLGMGEDAAGGRTKDSILADAFEAFIGALYLDGGANVARAFVTHVMHGRMVNQVDHLDDFDARSHLIRICVREFARPPMVEITSSGAAHEPVFTAHVVVNGEVVGSATGRTKKAAAQAASTAALSVLAGRGIDIGRA